PPRRDRGPHRPAPPGGPPGEDGRDARRPVGWTPRAGGRRRVATGRVRGPRTRSRPPVGSPRRRDAGVPPAVVWRGNELSLGERLVRGDHLQPPAGPGSAAGVDRRARHAGPRPAA